MALKTKQTARKVPWAKIARLYPALQLLIVVTPLAAIVALPFITQEREWLPTADKARALLATLLTAQSAIAALTLAVTLFVMQGVNTRRDADDRMYREYIRRSWVQPIFWGSITAVGITGSVFLAVELFSDLETTQKIAPGLVNLSLVAAIAFFANLVFSGLLFKRALHLAHPEHWATLRRNVNEDDVRNSVQAYLGRRQRAIMSLDISNPDISVLFPEHGEGSADEAVRSLIDDARRAMADTRISEFKRSIESIKALIEYAMTEIERGNIPWGAPGSQADWPPLRELGSNFYAFRAEVIREGNRDYILELLDFDSWLVYTAATKCCGELLSVGLNGQRRNNLLTLANASSELKDIIQRQTSTFFDQVIFGTGPEVAYPFVLEIIKMKEQMLSDSMVLDLKEDFLKLHEIFLPLLEKARLHWNLPSWPPSETSELYSNLEQKHRITLMGLAGRADILYESGKIADESPYTRVAREIYMRPDTLADDVVQAIKGRRNPYSSLWHDWEMEGSRDLEVRSIFTDKYPLTFFTIRLIELSGPAIPVLDLKGNGERILKWFMTNSKRLEAHARIDTGSIEEQVQYAAAALQQSVKQDEITEDYRIIASDLSDERVSTFKSTVYETASLFDPIEKIFQEEGAFSRLPYKKDHGPQERGFYEIRPKAYLAEIPSNGTISYHPLTGESWGRGLANHIMQLFCRALDQTDNTPSPLDTPEELLQAFLNAKEELGKPSKLVAVLAGNWSEIEMALYSGSHEGFVPAWQIPDTETDRIVQWGQYQGHSLLRGPKDGERRLYLVEPAAWGCFVRRQCEGNQDLHINFRTISAARAKELLAAEPNHFPDIPDMESKLRKLQTCVELAVGARIEFCVKDSSRAKKITAAGK